MKRLIPLVLAILALSACGSESEQGGDSSGVKAQELTVLAAASLKETYTTLAADFEKDHPAITVTLVFDSSATLAQMTTEGAPGDVLATADQRTMDDAAKGGGVEGTPTQFATNELVLATPAGNDTIDSLNDLDKGKYVVCVPTAPCGAAAKALLVKNDVTAKPASEEVDVKAVLQKVISDEADAGLVYRTDAVAAGDAVKAYDVPGSDDDPNTYWLAPTSNATDADLAKEWIALVTGDRGQRVLQEAGFGEPTS